MQMKSIVLAGAALLLAAPAAALADPYWRYGEGWRDGDGWRAHERHEYAEWRRHEWREHEAWEHRRYGWGYRRCFIERRGSYNWYGDYVLRSVRVCR